MRTRLVILLSLLAPPALADGSIELFWSTTGLASASMQYSTVLTNFLPMVSSVPVAELSAGTYDLYLWGRFNEGSDLPAGGTLTGIDLRWQGNATHGQNVAYRQRWGGPASAKRWDGSAGILLDNVMAAVTASGIQFLVPPASNLDLYFPESHEFVLGAAQITGAAGQTISMALDADLVDGLGPGYGPYWFSGEQYDPAVLPATLTFTPEPAGLVLLLGLTAIRRR